MHNSYSAFAHGLRAKSPFPYPFISSSCSPSDQDLLQNPYYNPSPYQRLPLPNGHFSKQSALLYWTPSRTFIAAAATYLATTRRSQVKLGHCTASNSSRSCFVTVRETRCCHSHCFCDQTSSSFREARSCNKGRDQKLLEREVTHARQVWRCNEDYPCDRSGDFELIERDVRRRERVLEPRFSDNARIEEHYDYWEIDNSRLRDDNSRNFSQRRRCDCEHDYEGNERTRLIDQRRRRRDECDDRFSDQRRRAEYDDFEDNERIRLSDRRRRRDEHDDKIRHSDRRRRAEYDDYDEVEDVRNREDRIKASDRRKREEYDFEDVDNYRRRRASHKFTDQKENDVYNEKYNNMKVLDQRRRDDSYNIHGADKLGHSDRWRRDENYDYDKEDKTRVSNQRRREGYYESDDKIRVSDQRRREDYQESDDKIRVSNRKEDYNYAEEDNKMQRDDRIRVSDRRGKEIYDERDSKLRVSDQRRRDSYYDYDNEDNIRVYDRRRRNEYLDYDHEDNIGVYDRRRNEYHDYDNEDNIRVSDRRRRDEHYDYDGEDNVKVSDRRRSDRNYNYGNEDTIRISDRRKRNVYYDIDGEDNVKVSDRRRSDRNYDYDNEDTIGISDRSKRNVYYDFDGEDNVKVSDQRKKEIYDARGNSLRVMDKSRRDEHYDFDEDNRISVSDRRRRAQDYKYDEEDRIQVLDQNRKQVLSKRNDKISMLDHTRREEADDYEEIFTNLQQRSSATRVSDPKLERQSRFKETRDEGSTSYIRQTGEREGKYRKERGHYDQKGSMEGSHIVKIISEDDSGLASREKENAVKITSASGAQLHSQSKTQIGSQNQWFGSSTSFRTEVAVEKEINNTLDQFIVSEVETDVQKGTHIGTGGKQVGTSSSIQYQVQIARDKKNIINQLAISEIELDLQNRSNVDIQRKMVDTSSTVQSASDVARDRNNVLNQLTVTEVESDLQNRSQIEAERRRVDASTSVQSVAEFTKIRQNVVNQVKDSEAESDVQSRIHMPAENRRIDESTSVQRVPQVATDKRSIPTWSEVVSTVKTLNRIEAERRRLLDASVPNETQVESERQKVVDQLAVGEVEANVQNRSQTETEKGVVDSASRTQNATQVAINRQKVVDELAATEIEVNVQNRSQNEAERGVVDAATGIYNVTQLTKEKSDVVNELMLHETEVNAVNRTDINQTTVNVNEASTLTDNLSGGAGSGTSIVLNQATGSSTETAGTPSLAAGSFSFRGSLESASRLDKSSSYHIGGFIDSAHEELLGGSERKGPSESLGDQKSLASHGTLETAASGITETETTVTRRTGQSLWAFVADIIKLGFLKGEARQLKSARRSSSSDLGTDDWFSGQEEMDIDIKNDDGKKDVEPLIVQKSDKAPSALNVSEVNLSGTDDVAVIPALQEKTVVEEIGGHEYTSIVGDANKFGRSKTFGVYAGGVVGSASVSLLEADISISESDQKGDSKRGKLLKRMTQVPKSSFDEWEEEHSREVETPTITATGVLLSEVTQVPDINTSLGNTMLELRPSEVMRNPGASASFSSATTDSTAVVDKGSRKHLRRLSQAPKESFEEWEEAYIREKEQRRLDEFFMREALVEAQRASDSWEVPVGAVLVRNGEVIARGCNLVEELRDSTAHAEMVCIREASNLLHSWRLSDTTLYVTLEPCAMCAGAILQARIDTVVWGAPNKLLGADGSWVRLFPGDGEASTNLESPVQQTGPVHPFHPKIKIRRGILEDECSEIMQQFFKLRRKKKNTKPETSTNPSCLPAHPLKFFSRFGGMFCT